PELLPDLFARLRVQELVETRARPDAHVMGALGAHLEVAGNLGAVQHRVARGALRPDPLGNRAARGAVGLDAGGQELFQPAHGQGATVCFLDGEVMTGEIPVGARESAAAAPAPPLPSRL